MPFRRGLGAEGFVSLLGVLRKRTSGAKALGRAVIPWRTLQHQRWRREQLTLEESDRLLRLVRHCLAVCDLTKFNPVLPERIFEFRQPEAQS
jgi:hypothetical protein